MTDDNAYIKPSPVPLITEYAKIGRYLRKTLPNREYILVIDTGLTNHVIASVPEDQVFVHLRRHLQTYNPLTGRQRV